MKNFIVIVTYLVPLEEIQNHLQEHRDYLQLGYDQGMLLCSGPQNPWTGGLAITRADSLESIQAFFNKDPYTAHGLAKFDYIEFEPSKFQPWIKEWLFGLDQ